MRSFLLLFAVLLSLAAPAYAQNSSVSVFDRVIKSGTIRCGYAMWTPILYQNLETQKLDGFAYELVEEIGKRLDLKIEWAEDAGWGTIVEGMSTKRYDMVCVGIGNTTGRAKVMDFTVPVFYSPILLVARANDARFDKGYEILNDPQYKISILEGEITSIIARQVYPKATTVSMPQMSDYSMLLKEVETSKGDVTLVTPETFADYNRNNPGKLKVLNQKNPTVFPVSFGLPQDDLAFKSMINLAINELLLDGTVERLLKKYEKDPGTWLRVSRPFDLAR